MAGVLGRGLFFVFALALAPAVHAAEPVLMFLLSVAKEMISAPRPAAAAPAPAPSTAYPGTNVEPAMVKRVIDESFLHLSQDQRDEVFQALHGELAKPANFAIRAPIIEHFTVRALQVRAAHQRLAKLTSGQKEALAAEFRIGAKTLPEDDVTQLREALEKRLLPVPPDLNQLLLAALP